ncbi:biopolymer transporter ExbB [Sinisalibacter aestuarii]|uniref:Biopolymer transporter ExbB n=1 Tax=Sinisalibacter aestuarii TaxID=2949426 RepID=A0ABQ5LWC6_9RHOB|nr:biopolymer transporter ExbB [Sinisalibacter aestuarii]GKY89277.1 hypothetical protein STA1M1_31460 [Sinisalibacter aestuarii]
MDQPDRVAEPNFTQPMRQVFLIVVALALVAAGVYVALPKVLPVFLANLYLNGFIAFVFIIGLLATIWQVVQVSSSVRWVTGYVSGRPGHDADHPPRLLAPLAGLLRGRGTRMQIGSASARSILDSVATRIDEERDITRYITNLLIFLGLLGTFYGLATVVPAVVDTIKSLVPEEGDGGVEVFNRLLTGLESQLGGMGTAFSSSLLGLAGSLVVGLLELFVTHGQNRFYRELEEWLTSITRIGFAPGEGEGPTEASGATAWLAHMSEQMESMSQMFTQSDVSRAQVDERLGQLADAVERLSHKIEAGGDGNAHLVRIAEGQERLIAALEGRSEEGGPHVDAESRMRLRSIDVQLLRILEEMSAGRQESLSDLRADLAALTRAIRQLGGGQG